MLSILVKTLSALFILVFLSEFTLANKVGLDNIAARAWTDRDSEYVGVNIQICFRSTYVENKKQKSNCLRLLSSMKGVKQYEHIIFETKNTQFNFKTNKRYGTNITFWLKERANEDTISLNLFLNQLNKTENAIVGGMCKKIAETKWLSATVRRALDMSNKVDPYIINRFKSVGYQDIGRIAKRCQATVEERIGNIELVKVVASKTTQKLKKCEYSKNKLLDLQSTLKYLDIYKSKVDGRYGPGTKKAIKIGKNKIFQFANRSSDCLSANELSWLKLLVSVKRKGQECKKFNSNTELREIAELLERIGRPVFSPFSAFDRIRYNDYDYRQVVYALIEYENSLDDDYFNVAQRSRDCRIITIEKKGLVVKAENSLANNKDNQSAKQVSVPTKGFIKHMVETGETIYSIARLYNVSVTSLARLNKLDPEFTIYLGQNIVIPITQNKINLPKKKIKTASKKLVDDQKNNSVPLSEKQNAINTKNTFVIPVKGKIISKYNPNNEKQKNQGIDFQVSPGSAVFAAASGNVALITDNTENFGKIILIRHDNNFISIYGRVANVVVKKNEIVTKGQKIGSMSEKINDEKDQIILHFELRQGTKSVNPENYFE